MCPNELQSLIDQGIVKMVPLDCIKNKVRWAHPDGYFMNAKGKIIAENFPPSQYVHRGGSAYPKFRGDCNHLTCHVAMALAFYGERPTYVNAKGQVRPYQAHHLNGNKFDYRPANILAWLHPDVHRVADNRQKALRTVVPDGDFTLIPYDRLRQLQDPRVLTDEEFSKELESIRSQGYHRVDPLAAAAKEPNRDFDPFVEHD